MDSVRGDLEFREGLPQLSGLRAGLLAQAKITQLRLRGHVWYVAQDPVSLQYFRFGPIEHAVVKLLDGQRTLREVHLELQRQFGAEAPGFQDIVAFVQMMRSSNLLQAAESQDLDALYERVSKRRSQRRKNFFANFLFLTIPLYDPDKFLARTIGYVRFLFTGWFLAVWVGVVATGLALGIAYLGDLARPAENVLSSDNLLLLWLCFVGLKVIHEFSHAYLAKHYGSEVHRMGILFLVFTPSAYVDVTGLWSVENKHHRALVGAAGMMAELFLGSIALFVWLATEQGTLHSLTYNVMFIATVSSVLFNGNPLLRYDGYYILSDWTEFPNLWQNARNYLLYLAKHYLLGIDQPCPSKDPREKIWFVVYGICSWIYRTLVVIGIILFISSALFGLGVLLGAAAVLVWILIPIGMLFHYLLFGRATRTHRLRCVTVLVLLLAAGLIPITQIPFPQYIYAPCVLIEQERSTLRARWGGFVDTVAAHDGDRVEAGQLVAVCRNDELAYAAVRTEKELDMARIRLALYDEQGNVAAAQVERFRIPALAENLRVLRERVESLRLTAPCDGQIIAPGLANSPGKFLKPGAPLALLARGPFTRIVVVMDQSGIADVQGMRGAADEGRGQGDEGKARPGTALAWFLWPRLSGPAPPASPLPPVAEVRFESYPGRAITCPITKILPQATKEVPSPSLTHQAGGPIVLDPSSPEGDRTLLPWFSVELELPAGETPPPLGTRGEACFEIGRRPLVQQWYYKLLRLLRTRYLI